VAADAAVTPAAAGNPATTAAPAPAGAGGVSAESLRAQWPAVLDAVKRERRVAWMILSNATVHSLQDGILTLRFSRDGDLKGFGTSGCDADLKRVLSASFGVNVMVNGIAGGPDSPVPEPVRPDPAPRADLPPPPQESYDTDEEPDDPPLPPGPPELTGMDLIQRELGAQIISEIAD
jgi:DNA polymerase III subunit gamma/tau